MVVQRNTYSDEVLTDLGLTQNEIDEVSFLAGPNTTPHLLVRDWVRRSLDEWHVASALRLSRFCNSGQAFPDPSVCLIRVRLATLGMGCEVQCGACLLIST